MKGGDYDMGKKVMCFNLEASSLKIKEIINTKDFIAVEIWAISDEYPNNNTSHFPYKSFQETIDKKVFYNKPILGKFNNVTNNYEVHNSTNKYDSEYDVIYKDYEDGERPLGVIRESDNIRIETDEYGNHWIVFTAVLWVKYNYAGIKKILQSKHVKVSVEVTVTKYHTDDNGIEIFDEWIFDGVTILGFLPNSTKPVREGINNAHLTILEKMNQNTFANQIKSIQFAYNELAEIQEDIKEKDSHLYIENNKKEGIKLLTYEQKRDILDGCLAALIDEDSYSWVMDIDDNYVYFCVDRVKYRASYSIDEETKECKINYDEKTQIISDYRDFSEEEKEEENQCGKQMGTGCYEDGCDPEDDGHGDSDDNDDEGHDDSDDDDKEDGDDDEKDGNDSEPSHSEEESKDEDKCNCGKLYTVNNKQLTSDQLFEQYISETQRLKEHNEYIMSKYEELNKTYEELNSQNQINLEKLKIFEENEEKNRIEQFCQLVDDIAKKEHFSEEEITLFKNKCKNKEYSTTEDIEKDMAYESFKKKKQSDFNTQEKNAEFSAPAEKIKVKKEENKKFSNPFDGLKAYVENK